jgi:hypothetical protein
MAEVVQVEFIPHRVQMLTCHETHLVLDRPSDQRMVHIFFDNDLSHSTHAQRPRQRGNCYRRHEHFFCAALLFVAFAPDSHVQNDGLRQHLDLERESTPPCFLHRTARYSGLFRACVCQYLDLDSKVLRRDVQGLAISVLRCRSVVAQSFKVNLLLVGISPRLLL